MAKKKVSLSVLKRQRQNKKRRERNQQYKSKVKTLTKKLKRLLEEKEKNLQHIEALKREVLSAIDKVKKKRMWHPNKCARKKSQVEKLCSSMLKQA